jgi:transposase
VQSHGGSKRVKRVALPSLWTFVRFEGVEPTNNAAERAIRPGVLWRKGSFGTYNAQGSRFVEVI